MCLICYQSFSQNCELKKQVELIHNKHPHNCRICDKSFSHKCNKKHVWKVHEIRTTAKSIKAQVAIRVVLKKIESNHHTLITSWNSKSSKCLICYQSFSQKCEYKRHIDLIIIIKDSHNSRICYKSFSHKLQLGLLLFSNGCSISWAFSTCF